MVLIKVSNISNTELCKGLSKEIILGTYAGNYPNIPTRFFHNILKFIQGQRFNFFCPTFRPFSVKTEISNNQEFTFQLQVATPNELNQGKFSNRWH